MSLRESPVPGDSAEEEISRLVATLRDTERRLEELTAGEVDSVMGPDGRMFLLQRAQEQLRNSDATRQAAILNALPAHIALLDGEGVIVSVNEAWRIFADDNSLLAPGHALGVNYLEICDQALGDGSAEAPRAAAGIRSVLDGTSSSFVLEYPCHSPAEQRWFLMTVTPLADDRSGGAVVMHLSITARKQAELAFQALSQETARRERILNLALSSMSDFAQVYDREGRLLYVNQPLLKLWGQTLDAVVGKNFFDLGYPAELAARLQRQLQQVFATRQSVTDETRYTSPAGEAGDYEYIFSPVIAADGTVDLVVGSTRDITGRKRTETALGVAELKYRSIFEHSSEGIFQTTPEGRFISGNPALARILGYASPEEVVHERTDLERQGYVDPAMREKFKRLIEQHGFVRDFEYESRRKDGTTLWLSENTRLVRDAAGRIVCYEGSLQDITARKQAELALQASERRQRELAVQLAGEKERLLEAQAVAKVGSWETDLVTLKVKWSEETHRIYDTDPATFQNTHQAFLQLVHPDDRAAVDEAFFGSFGQRSPWVMEHRLLLPDGRIKFVEERWKTFVDEAGKPVRALGTAHDITERRRALQAVTDSQARLSALLEHSSDVIAISGVDGRLLYVSPSIRKVGGYEPQELVGASFMSLVHPGDQAGALDAFKELLRQPERVQRLERRYRRKDGSWMDAENISVNLAHIPGVGGIVSTMRDVTERKRAERQLQASAADLKETQRLARLGSWHLEFRTGALRWSDETFAVFGRDPAQGAPRYDELATLLTAQSFAAMDAALRTTREQGSSFEIDLEVVRADQSRRWIHANGEPLRDATGAIGAAHGTALDITERKAGEIILQKHASELERFHRLSVGREMRMIELKKQVNELARQAGQKPPYDERG